ncbi:MAG: hypothetical protein ACXV3D_04865 [Halobacteriota archaeon]
MDKKTLSASVIALIVIIAFVATTMTVSAADDSVTITGLSSIYAGQDLVVSGAYLEAGLPKAGTTIEVYDMGEPTMCSGCHEPVGTLVGSAVTGDNGVYTVSVVTPAAGDHVFRAIKVGSSAESPLRSDPLKVHVIAWSLTLGVPTETIPTGQTFAVTGRYTEDGVGAAPQTGVEIYEVLTTGGNTQTAYLAGAALTAEGYYTATIGPLTAGDHVIQASIGGAPDSMSWARSDQKTVTVESHEKTALKTAEKLQSDLQTGNIPATVFQSTNNAKAFSNKLGEVIASINTDDHTTAMRKIQNDLMKKTDGNSNPQDWVKDPTQAAAIYGQLKAIYDELALA